MLVVMLVVVTNQVIPKVYPYITTNTTNNYIYILIMENKQTDKLRAKNHQQRVRVIEKVSCLSCEYT